MDEFSSTAQLPTKENEVELGRMLYWLLELQKLNAQLTDLSLEVGGARSGVDFWEAASERGAHRRDQHNLHWDSDDATRRKHEAYEKLTEAHGRYDAIRKRIDAIVEALEAGVEPAEAAVIATSST